MSAFLDIFYIRSTHFSNGIVLSRYIKSARDNWDNFNLDNRFISNIANNDSPKSEPKDFNRLGDNLNNLDKIEGIYN